MSIQGIESTPPNQRPSQAPPMLKPAVVPIVSAIPVTESPKACAAMTRIVSSPRPSRSSIALFARGNHRWQWWLSRGVIVFRFPLPFKGGDQGVGSAKPRLDASVLLLPTSKLAALAPTPDPSLEREGR